ncbi:MAG: Ku protein [Janthinobacterium lividum]
MARPYWSGQITISLVSFGVKLFVATEAKSQIQFHQIDRASGERVRYQKMVASAVDTPAEEREEPAPPPVQQSQIIKGYEYSKGQYVTIEPEELANLRVPSKHTMEVMQFVDEEQISPEYFEKPYFVVPENEAQTEAFATVRQALIDTKKIALTKIAFAGREHVVAISPAGTDANGGMMAYTMRYAAELRDATDYFRDIKRVEVSEDSLDLAKMLIKKRAGSFDPSQFVDGYEVAVKELVDAKLNHLPVPQEEAPAPARGKVINLMDALRKSIGGGTRAEEVEEAPAVKKPAARQTEKRAEPAQVEAARVEAKSEGISLVKGAAPKPAKAAAKREAKAPAKSAAAKRKSA